MPRKTGAAMTRPPEAIDGYRPAGAVETRLQDLMV